MEDYESGENILETTDTMEPQAEASQEVADQGAVEAQPTQTDWNGEEYALNFRGEKIIPKSKDELINLAQFGHLYNSKQSEWTEKSKQLEERSKAVEQYEQLAKAFSENPRFQQQIMDMYYGSQYNGQAQQQDQSIAQLPPEFAEKITSLEQQVNQFQQAQADQSLEQEISGLRDKYAQFDWKTMDTNGDTLDKHIMRLAHDMGGVPLETAFRHAMWEQGQEMAKADALRAAAEAKQQQSTKGKATAAPQSNSPAPQQPNVSNMSYDDIAQGVISGQLT